MFNKKSKKLQKTIEKSGLFDKVFYLKTYRDVRLADMTPIEHYVNIGIKEDRKPNATFEPTWYREYYTDVKEDGTYPLVHYILFGRKENRFQNEAEKNEYEKLQNDGFDVEFYKKSYEDLAKITDETFDFILHYIRYGKFENRKIKNTEKTKKIYTEQEIAKEGNKIRETLFDTEYYLNTYIDVKNSGIDPETHYYEFGEKEGRRPNQFFEPIFYYNLNADVRVANISAFWHFQQNGYQEGRLGKLRHTQNRNISKTSKPLLFVGHDGIIAGAQTVLLEVVRWFATHTTRRVKTLLLDSGPMANDYVKYGEVYVLFNKQVDDVDKFKSFLNEDFEFVYLSTVVSGIFLKLLRESEIKINADIFANIHEMEKVLDIFPEEMHELQRQTKHWISGSPESTKVLIDKYKISKEQLTTVPAFIKPITKQEDSKNLFKDEVRNLLKLNDDDFVVMGCGTVYWRKGPDIFVETAKKLKRIVSKNIQFVWIGDGEDRQKIESSLTAQEKKYIHFIGHQENAALLLAAADVFFLSSREDPFPLVVLLAAQHHVPTVCFKEATGITEFVQEDAGCCLSKIDSDSAAQTLKTLMDDNTRLLDFGIKAHERVFSLYTSDKKMVQIFDVIKNNTNYKPSVSVIVPIYNHEAYIEERLDSILAQEIKDIEIIALDDCSTDGSVEKVKGYLTDPRIKLFLNKTNSGSPFKQWKKGIELAKSDIVWIAEGDDSCSENFLSQLLPYFDDKLINIAYAKTEMTNENGELQKDAFKPYFEKAYPEKFDSSYVKTGIEEVNEQLGAMCTLVNASGLLIRKSSFGETLNDAQTFKMCGDWLIYLECLKNGKIAYDINAINYFRRHSASQVKKVEGTDIYFNERKLITEYVFSNFTTTKQLRIKAFEEVDFEWERFKYKNPDTELSAYYNKKQLWQRGQEIQKNRLLSVAIVASDFSPGGGQLFSIRLANALKKIGVNVIILNVEHFPDHPEVMKKIDEHVPVYKTNDIEITDVLRTYDIDIIHSSIWWADKYVHEVFQKMPSKVKWVVSMHGCYETLLEHMDAEPDFKHYFENMLLEVDGWVYTAEKNKNVFEAFYRPNKLVKIVNGYEPEIPKKLERDSIGIREGSFVFCLASRAIETKGWYLAVEAVDKLNEMGHKVDLLLIGEGEAKAELEKIANCEYIHFIGQVSNLQDYIAISDVGLLPTFFLGESMPLVLIEFMARGKPMISTNVGEIKDMTSDEEGSAAVILDLHQNTIDSEELVNAMQKICTDEKQYKKLEVHSKRLFQRFEMSKMIDEYTKIYIEVINKK